MRCFISLPREAQELRGLSQCQGAATATAPPVLTGSADSQEFGLKLALKAFGSYRWMDAAIIYQEQVPTCPENQLRKQEMSEREENQTSVFVLFYPGPAESSWKSYFSLSAGMLPGMAVTATCHCWWFVPCRNVPSSSCSSPGELVAPSKVRAGP